MTSRADIIEQCNSNKSGHYLRERFFSQTWPDVYEDFQQWNYSHLHQDLRDQPFKVRIWHFLHEIDQPAKAPECNQTLRFVNFKVGYRKFCKQNCKCMVEYANKSREATSLERYGTSHPMKTKENRDKVSQTKLSYSQKKKDDIDKKRKETMIDRYGVDNPNKSPEILAKRVESFKSNIDQWRESYQQTSNERYGTDHPWSSPQVRAKYEQTMIQKYGNPNPMQCENIRDKAIETNLARYGHKYTVQADEVKAKIKETILAKYNCTNPAQNNKVKAKISKKVKASRDSKLMEQHSEIVQVMGDQLIVNCDSSCKCGGQFKIDRYLFRQRKKFGIETCTEKKPVRASGYLEESVMSYLDQLGVNYVTRDRSLLGGQELDILIPDLNFAIEVNGTWWHNELYRPKPYHQQKTMAALDVGINLFQLWEDDWLYKGDIVKSMLASRLNKSINRIGARKCELMEVSPMESFEFLERNHLQGGIRATVHLGLYYNNDLVAVACFGRGRKAVGTSVSPGKWELYRFATILNTNVIGGFSKLLKYFIMNWNPSEIMTYASLDHSTGEVYVKSGFMLSSTTKPGYYWVVDGIRRHRYGFTKHKLVKKGADQSKTEVEIMHDMGHYRIWDAGNLKFTLLTECNYDI